MDTLAAGVRHRRDSGGPTVDQQWQGLGSSGARSGQVVTTAVRSRVRPATLWMRVVSMAVIFFLEGLRLNFALLQPWISLIMLTVPPSTSKIEPLLVFQRRRI